MDAVIGVVKGYGWPELRNYAVSLAKCGFAGEKILFVDGVSEEAIANLTRLGFNLVPYTNPESIRSKKCGSQEDALAWGFFGRWRFRPVIDYLRATIPFTKTPRIGGFRYIVWCDVRDVLFQTDPSVWLEEHLGHNLVGAAEGYLIGNQQHNAYWAQRTSPEDYEWLCHEEVLCSGTFAGKASTMLEVFEHMFALHKSVKDPTAFDQGLWNLTARTTPFVEYLHIPKMSEGFCATGWPSKNLVPGMKYATDVSPLYGEDFVVYTPDGVTPFSIVHQFDREPEWAAKISEIMAAADAPPPGKPIILIASCEAYRHNGFNAAARETWLAKWGHLIDYRFVYGVGVDNLLPDEISVEAADVYCSLPYKVRAARRWATKNGYGHSFMCGSDTYVHVPRLLDSGFEAFDYLGFLMHDMHRLFVGRNIQFAQGGGGYWLGPRAAAAVEVAEIPIWVKSAEDVFVGNALFEAGIEFTNDNGYWGRCNPEEPVPTEDVENHAYWKSLHLSKWRGTPKYDPQWMREAHEVWKDR